MTWIISHNVDRPLHAAAALIPRFVWIDTASRRDAAEIGLIGLGTACRAPGCCKWNIYGRIAQPRKKNLLASKVGNAIGSDRFEWNSSASRRVASRLACGHLRYVFHRCSKFQPQKPLPFVWTPIYGGFLSFMATVNIKIVQFSFA